MSITAEVGADASAALQPLDRDAFVAALRAQAPQYHDRHPFHVLMNQGQLNQRQIQGWVANRFYYQEIIPIKDAAILSNCPYPEVRRRWIQRVLVHDGEAEGRCGTEAWLRLAEAGWLDRQDRLHEHMVVPTRRFAGDPDGTLARPRPRREG